jgi:hypothetical protein
LTDIGLARLNPADDNVPEIGDELAVARALADLINRLLTSAAADIGEDTHERDVRVRTTTGRASRTPGGGRLPAPDGTRQTPSRQPGSAISPPHRHTRS